MRVIEEIVALEKKYGEEWPEHTPDDLLVVDIGGGSAGDFLGDFVDLFDLDRVHSGILQCDWYYDDNCLYIRKVKLVPGEGDK